MSEIEFELTPVDDLPSKRGAVDSGIYYQILHKFVKSDMDTAGVSKTNKKMQTLVVGLRKAIEDKEFPVKVITREGEVFLKRIDR